jgi:lysozyme family protein
VTEDEAIDAVIEREGGFVDHPADRAGGTKFGVTMQTLSRWRGAPATREDVRNLSVATARNIYRSYYIAEPGFRAIANETVRALVFDSAVHHGVGGAVRLIQRALRFPLPEQDGVFGPKTRAAVSAADPAALYRGIVAERAKKFGVIITSDPSQSVFAAGWMNRLAGWIEQAPAG